MPRDPQPESQANLIRQITAAHRMVVATHIQANWLPISMRAYLCIVPRGICDDTKLDL
jgi:hypothetical protein